MAPTNHVPLLTGTLKFHPAAMSLHQPCAPRCGLMSSWRRTARSASIIWFHFSQNNFVRQYNISGSV